jgi:NhaC family Na+:H+ antiporter
MSNRRISAGVSLIPLLTLIVLLFLVVRAFGADALDGGSQVALLLASGVVIAIAMLGYKVPWSSLEGAIADNIKSIGTAVIVLLLIGAVAGSWMVSGIVPTLIYYGLKVLSPKIFLLAVCLICALVSLMTGSSWTTVATIGTAFIGIGLALGFSPGWTAGAILSGAYFGDKISPLSDTTVLASSVTETPLFTHIRYMLITTVPSISIACIIFLIASLTHQAESTVMAADFSQALKGSFHISGWLLLVPVVTGILIAKKLPAMITLSVAALLAAVTSLIAQPEIISTIGNGSAFKGVLISVYGNTSIETGFEALDSLVQTKGMNGMMSTIFLIFCASTFGGTLKGSGMIQSLTDALTRHIKGRTSLVASTVATGIFSNLVAGDQYLSIILTTSLYKKLFDDMGYESRLLSRSAEDSATVTSVLIPWNSCGMTQSTVLKVPTLEYLPYCFFNLISPVMSVLVAAIGYKITRRKMVP